MTLVNLLSMRDQKMADPAPGAGIPDAEALRLRWVHRAAAELRRGAPVLLDAPDKLVILAAETASSQGLAEFAALSVGPPLLLLAPVRAAAVLRRPVEPSVAAVTLSLGVDLPSPEALRSLADPTADQSLAGMAEAGGTSPAPAGAALSLAKLARLLPAMLALRQWGEKWALGARCNPVLCDARDGQPIAQITLRAHDDRVVGPGELVWRDATDFAETVMPLSRINA